MLTKWSNMRRSIHLGLPLRVVEKRLYGCVLSVVHSHVQLRPPSHDVLTIMSTKHIG